MTSEVRAAIEAADPAALRALVAADAGLADADVTWGRHGKNRVPPLHYVCDAVFRKLASEQQALAMADVLLEAGVDAELRDQQYDCTPLEWVLHAWTQGTNGCRDGLPRVARVLVESRRARPRRRRADRRRGRTHARCAGEQPNRLRGAAPVD